MSVTGERQQMTDCVPRLQCAFCQHRHAQRSYPNPRDFAHQVFDRKSEYQLNDSADYYFDKVTEISAPG